MILTNNRATGPLTSRLPNKPNKPTGGDWLVARVENPNAFAEAILGGYSCDCNGRTLLQINRTTDFEARVQLGATCHNDGNRTYLPYRRMPWMVEEYMVNRETWLCDSCDREIGNLQTLDGVVVGVELECPLCHAEHVIDLTLSALPERLKLSAFGIEPPAALLAPPAYAVLKQMWECIQDSPSNRFVYLPYTVRHDMGQVQHIESGKEFEASVDHITQLSAAKLIEDGEHISISRSGVIVCLRDFGGSVG